MGFVVFDKYEEYIYMYICFHGEELARKFGAFRIPVIRLKLYIPLYFEKYTLILSGNKICDPKLSCLQEEHF